MKQDYLQRRQTLAKRLPQESLAIIPGARECLRNGDTHYPFRQDSDFYYLTGFNEPDALLVVMSGSSDSYLFNRQSDLLQEQWTGKRLGQANAPAELGITQAYAIDAFPEQLLKLLSGKQAIYYPIGRHHHYEKQLLQGLDMVKAQIRRGVKAPEILCDIEPVLSELRLIKTESEIHLMRQAAAISVTAHQRAMSICRQVNYEYQLEAELLYEFKRQGCQAVAYEPIVAAGGNACILHYTQNNQPLRAGDLVLIDAGGEFANYAADITRTFPISGQFSPEQRAIYSIVLEAQKAAIQTIKPGATWNNAQEVIIHILTQGLCELGILQGNVETLIAEGAYKPFYMHNSGHWLGLDVHDCGRYKVDGEWRTLQAGMALTVEPGLYISAGMEGVESRWWNIGVRIEDDILVTADGYENLTSALPKEIADIEALMHG